jgi:hypothetical protein
MSGVRVSATVVLMTAILSVAGGCSITQERAITSALNGPPVDLRALPTGVEVGFVCGPGVPWAIELQELDQTGHLIHTVFEHSDFLAVRATRSLLLPVPLAFRRTRLHVTLVVHSSAQPKVAFRTYGFEFRYVDLPRNQTKRVAGAPCR